MGQAFDRFNVLRKDINPRAHNLTHRLEVSGEIWGQRFDLHSWRAGFDGANRSCKMRRAAVKQIIPINTGQNRVFQVHQFDALGDVFRLERIESALRVAGVDRTELTGPSADRTHQHEGRRTRRPTFGDVRTHCLLTDGGQVVPSDDLFDARVTKAGGQRDLQPVRFPGPNRLSAIPVNAVLDDWKIVFALRFNHAGT